MSSSHPFHFNLVVAAHAAMIEHGFQPDFPAATGAELAAIQAHPAPPAVAGIKDYLAFYPDRVDAISEEDAA